MYNQELVDKFYPTAQVYQAMEIWKLPNNKQHLIQDICEKQEYFAQIKKDGHWYSYNLAKSGASYLFSRGESVKTSLPTENSEKVPHLIESLSASLPTGTVILGEIYYPNKTADEVKTVMGCAAAKAIQRQNAPDGLGKIYFYIHDILAYEGNDLTQVGALERYHKLKTIYESSKELVNNQYIQLAEIYEEDLYNLIFSAFDAGEEGTVFKLKNSVYSESLRPAWQSIKFKKEDSVDAVCMGFEEPTKVYTGTELSTWQYWELTNGEKHLGNKPSEDATPLTKPFFYEWKNSIVMGGFDIDNNLVSIGTVSSGIDDVLKEDLAKNPQQYIGKTIEIKCMSKNENALRHGIFIRFRDDKNPRSCTLQSIFEN